MIVTGGSFSTNIKEVLSKCVFIIKNKMLKWWHGVLITCIWGRWTGCSLASGKARAAVWAAFCSLVCTAFLLHQQCGGRVHTDAGCTAALTPWVLEEMLFSPRPVGKRWRSRQISSVNSPATDTHSIEQDGTERQCHGRSTSHRRVWHRSPSPVPRGIRDSTALRLS